MWKTHAHRGSYRLGIKRWWGYKVYHVTNHRHKTYIMRNELKNLLNIQPTLDLELVDGSQISIPDIESRQWKLYPEYRIQEAKKARAAARTKLTKAPDEDLVEPKHESEISPEELPRTLQ